MSITTKHLSESARERICREICHIEKGPDKKGELFGLCPIHGESETTASLSFSYNVRLDVYHCFSCGADGDLIKLYTEINHMSQKDGFKSFCEKYKIPSGENSAHKKDDRPDAEISVDQTIALMNEAWEKFPPLTEEWLVRLEKERGWSRKWIEILNLRLQTHRLDKKTGRLAQISKPVKLAIPIFDERGTLQNIRLYEPGEKQFKIISFAQSTGDARLFPAKPQDGIILLCEGESDTICALSHGFNAITQTSKLKNWPDEHLKYFKGRDVIIAYDADQAGQKYTRFAAESLAGQAKSVRVIQWPAFMGIDESGGIPKDHGQDLTDFFVRHGKAAADLYALIDNSVSWAKAASGIVESKAEGTVDDTNDMLQFFDHGVNNRFSFKPRLLAEKIISDMKLLSDPETGLMFRWNGKIWDIFDEDHIRRIAIEHLRDESQKSRIEDAVYQAKMLSTIPHGRKLNDKDDWICLKNGMLNLTTFEMASHDPDYLSTYSLPVSFDPESTKRCERWQRYLLETVQTPEPIAQIQEFFGFCFVRHTKYEKCLLLLGPGADGKSTMLKILREMLGGENCAAVSFPDLENEFHRSSLYHKLINISTEIGSQAIESPYFKALVSGDMINAAFKHKNAFTFQPYAKLCFSGNAFPRVRGDNSTGLYRRFLPIQFKHQFLEGDPLRDPDLFDALKDELSEIFCWSLCGLERLREQRFFTMCDETKALMMSYRRSNNPVLCWVEDETFCDENAVAEKKELYDSYRKYCGTYGYMPLNYDHFYKDLLASINNLKLYRPQINGERKNKIRGIEIRSVSHVD